MASRILLVDADADLLMNLQSVLCRAGFEVCTSNNGRDGLRALVRTNPDLVLVDLALSSPDERPLPGRFLELADCPVVGLVEADRSDLKIPDDLEVIHKPVDPAAILEAVEAYLRSKLDEQKAVRTRDVIEIGNLRIDIAARDAYVNGRAANLTAKEFELLTHLGRSPGTAWRREELFETVWGFNIEFSSNSLEVFVYRLRQKLPGNAGHMIKTVRGYGYKLETA